MTTWQTVTISGLSAAGLKIDELEDIYTPYLYEGNQWDVPLVHNANTGKLTASEDCAYVSGRSKYRVDEIETWIKQMTLDHPQLTITWDQEWDDDDMGQENTVWRGGELVREESLVSGMIPLDWAALVLEAKSVLATLEDRTSENMGPGDLDRARDIVRRLTEALDQ